MIGVDVMWLRKEVHHHYLSPEKLLRLYVCRIIFMHTYTYMLKGDSWRRLYVIGPFLSLSFFSISNDR